jgi:hypothetical protein
MADKKTVSTKPKTIAPVKPKKQPAKTPVKKQSTKKRAPRKAPFTDKDFEKFLFKLDLEHLIFYTKQWSENNLKLKIPKLVSYDEWLNYFKTLTPSTIRILATTGVDFLPTEAYAALSRWHDIIKSPHRIDKIHQSGLTGTPDKNKISITQLAKNNDRMGVLMAVRDQLAEKLEKGAGARDMASLAREMGDVLDQIADLEKRAGPRKGSKLNELLGEFDVKRKRPGKNGGGARNTSFKSRTSIADMEGS